MKLMKNYLSLLAVLLLMGATCVMYTSCDDDDPVPAPDNSDTHEYVDLGLPTGTLWATCNLGADSPEEYGDYFAWGETAVKDSYSWDTYKWRNSNGDITKYTTLDEQPELLPEDDAATANWGRKWQMPSREQIEELINPDYTTSEWTTRNGVNGLLITSKMPGYEVKSIFLPAAGYYYNSTELYQGGEQGYYWSRTPQSILSHTYYLHFSIGIAGGYRSIGRTIRPVRK